MRRTRSFGAGFSLVELAVTVAVLSLLAAISVPAYFQMIQNVHRAEAKGLLSSLYGMEVAFFAEHQRFGCLNEVGFRIEGSGHFGVWVCDSAEGCACADPPGGACGSGCNVCSCPCMARPDDWLLSGGGGVANRFDPTRLLIGEANASVLPVGAGVDGIPMSSFPFPSVPVTLPADCARLMERDVFEAVSHNWCRRAVPEVVDYLWFTTPEGKQVFHVPMQDGPPADMEPCASGGGLGPPL